MDINKTANDNMQLLLMSLLGGGGAYAGARGLKDMSKLLHPDEKPKNELQITLPAARLPKTAGFAEAFNEIILPGAAVGGGLIGGFQGASSIFEKLKKKQIDKELKESEQDYLSSLGKVRSKVASVATPNIDAFVEGIFEKCGEEMIKAGFENIFAKPDFLGKENLLDAASGQVTNLVKGVGDTEVGKWLMAGMMAAGLGTAGLTYSTAKKLDGRKDKEDASGAFPNEVRLNITR